MQKGMVLKSFSQMIPIKLQPPPSDFTTRVSTPGQTFLSSLSGPPTEREWNKHPYWRRSIKHARKVYCKTCAYCATQITYSTGNGSIDHFISRHANPSLAYTWSNFRYVSARFNSRKGIRIIVDPFAMKTKWFTMDFPSLIIRSNKRLSKANYQLAENTINFLQLNDDDDLIDERTEYYKEYKDGDISLNKLKKIAPFMASEIRRKGELPNPKKIKSRKTTKR
jgi:hypothetical protein